VKILQFGLAKPEQGSQVCTGGSSLRRENHSIPKSAGPGTVPGAIGNTLLNASASVVSSCHTQESDRKKSWSLAETGSHPEPVSIHRYPVVLSKPIAGGGAIECTECRPYVHIVRKPSRNRKRMRKECPIVILHALNAFQRMGEEVSANVGFVAGFVGAMTHKGFLFDNLTWRQPCSYRSATSRAE